MKGVIFNVVEEVVLELYDATTWDAILDKASAGGAYTALGNYEDTELVDIVGAASEMLSMEPHALLVVVGEYALPHLASRMPEEVEAADDARSFLLRVNDIIHPEVLKLYPDARPPEFEFEAVDNDKLRVRYRSARQMDALAEGLIRGCGRLFDERVDVIVEATTADSGEARFLVSFHPLEDAPSAASTDDADAVAGATNS